MKWDAGALSKYRYNSPIYRFLSNKAPRSICWPQAWLEELGIFLATPGVTWEWCSKNFNMPHQRLGRIWNKTTHVHHLGMENALSATHDDALMYMKHKPFQGETPWWVEPFIIDDLKSGLSWAKTNKKWNITSPVIQRLLKGTKGNVFHLERKSGRWNHLGRPS